MSVPAPGLLHPLLATRASPARFDRTTRISDAALESLLEAARWAPSAGNSQPWAFITARRGEPDHDRLCGSLARSSAAWAPHADLLVANLRHVLVEDTAWEFSEFSAYDLGQAVAHMTIQAQSLGLAVRQFRAFDRDFLAAEFELDRDFLARQLHRVGTPLKGHSTGPEGAVS